MFAQQDCRACAASVDEIVGRLAPVDARDGEKAIAHAQSDVVAHGLFHCRGHADGRERFGERAVRKRLAVDDDAVEIEDDGTVRHGGSVFGIREAGFGMTLFDRRSQSRSPNAENRFSKSFS